MARPHIGAALALLIALLIGHGSAAQALEPLEVDWEQVFRLDWRVSESDGQPLIFGKIYNVSFYATNRIQLLVDRLDASGGTVAQQVAWLGFGLKPGDSAFFDVPVGDRAVAYRVRVFAFNRKLGTIQD